jgi:plasmid stabilization system protein ParE
MARVLKREAAKRDLIAQWVWYADTASILDLLFTQPVGGTPFWVEKTDLQGMRRFPVSDGFEKNLLFYFPLSDGVDLVRVVHRSRQLTELFAYAGHTIKWYDSFASPPPITR